eukprot:2920504-Heterocapsa_arctica.AAC.1
MILLALLCSPPPSPLRRSWRSSESGSRAHALPSAPAVLPRFFAGRRVLPSAPACPADLQLGQ